MPIYSLSGFPARGVTEDGYTPNGTSGTDYLRYKVIAT